MASSARFGGPTGFRGRPGYSVRFNANSLIHLTDKVTGQFRQGTGVFQQTLRRVHEQAAADVVEGMIESLQKSVKATGRKQRGTGLLEISLRHENNRDVTASMFLVGRTPWLNQSPAKLYWRRIEQGDNKTFDSKILFTNLDGRYALPWSPRDGGERPTPPGYKHMRMPQHRGVFVQNIGPFPAYHYSAGGAAKLRRMRMGQRYETALGQIGIPMTELKK